MNVGLLTAILFGSLVGAIFIGLPVAFAAGGVAAIFIMSQWGVKGLSLIATTAFTSWTNFILVAIPLFILMAEFLERSGIADELYDLMYKWFGSVKGGLAIGTIVICAIFAAMSGISSLGAVTMGLIALPAMLKRGYNKQLGAGAIAAGGTLGILIPPSVNMVVYAYLAGESVGQLFMAGVIPGILLALIFIIYIAIVCHIKPELGPPLETKFPWREKWLALRSLILPVVLIGLVLGTIYLGIATPTEAAGIGAFGAFLILLGSRRLTWSVLTDALSKTFILSCMIMWIVLGAKSFSHVYTALGASNLATGLISGLEVNRWLIILLMQLLLFALGMFLDSLGIMLITIPVFVPVVQALGFDLVWFGILLTINLEMGLITPPFGITAFVLAGVTKPMGITIGDIYKGIMPFVALMIGLLALVMIFPQLALWLPSVMMRK